MMACSKGLGLPRSMLLVMLLFMSLLFQHAQAAGDLATDCDPNAATNTDVAHPDVACKTATDTGLTCPAKGKCVCPTAKPKFDATKKVCEAAAAGTPTTTAGSKTGSADSSAVRTFIPSIIALAGLFLGVGVLSTF